MKSLEPLFQLKPDIGCSWDPVSGFVFFVTLFVALLNVIPAWDGRVAYFEEQTTP